MSYTLNPNTIYYLLIYVIIFVLRFFKIYRDVKNGADGNNWRHYFFVSLELVYSSAGIVIMLLAAVPQWASVTIMAYIILLLVTAFLDAMGKDFPESGRLGANVAVIAAVVILSVSFNQTLLYSKSSQSGGAGRTLAVSRKYSVAIPYTDLTLRKYVGEKLGSRTLVFVTTVEAPSRDGAAEAAKRIFWDEKSGVCTFDSKRPKSPENILPDNDRMVVESRT